jgi:monofunctional biosynthetic peptidoglycan transglycosylase
MIAGCLPNPKKFRVQPPSNYISRRYPQIMVQMNNIEPDEDIQKLLQTSTKK